MSVFNLPVVGLGRRCPGLRWDDVLSQGPATSSRSRLVVKRCGDFLFASLALMVLSPLFAFAAILVKLDRGPVFSRQRRVGTGGVEFWSYTFRTSPAGAECRRGALVTRNEQGRFDVTFQVSKKNPQITRVGQLLRKTNLDDLLLFWNVLRGEMTLARLRPALIHNEARYRMADRRMV